MLFLCIVLEFFFFLSIMIVFDLIDLCVSLHIRGMKNEKAFTIT